MSSPSSRLRRLIGSPRVAELAWAARKMGLDGEGKADICDIAAFAAQETGILDPRLFER